MAERDVIINLVVKGGDTSAQQLEKVAQSEQDVAVSAGQATKALDAQSKELNENAQATAQVTKQNQSLRGQLRAIQQELAKLALAGKANTAEYKRLRDEAGELQDAIGDAAAEIRQAGSDTRGLDKVIRVASTATAAFGLVQGAAALFGDENEELQKSLLKVNAALTVLTSLQQIQEELSRKDSIFTSAAAKAKALYAAATAGATGALGAFRIALIATGIGAAVVAIGLLIANWDKLKKAVFGSVDSLKEVEAANKALIESIKTSNDELDLELLRLKAKGVQEKELLQIAKQKLQALFDEARANRANLESTIALEKAKAAERITNVRSGSAFQKSNKIKESGIAIDKKYEEQLKTAIEVYNQTETAVLNNTIAINDLNNKKDESAKKTKKETEEIKAQAGSIAFLNAQIQKLTELQSKTADVTQIAKYQQQIDDLQSRIEILNREIALFISFQNRVSENAEANFAPIITQVQRVKTDAELASEAYEKLPQAIKDANAELSKNPPPSPYANAETPEQIKARRQTEIQENIQQAQLIADGTLAVFRQAQAARQQILDNRLKQGLITEQEYEEEVAKLRRKQAIADKLQAVFNATLSGIQAYLAALKFGPVFAGVIAALAAAQIAAIAATPIPKFRKGGDVDILKGGRERLGELFGNSHERGGILIEAEGGEHITRKTMAKKYRPLLHAINSDTVDTFLNPKALPMPMHKRLSNSEIKSSRQAEKRMAELIEEVRFLSQYVRQGNKYAKVTADTNTQMVNKKTTKVYV
jgi:hypothetical protein